MATIDLIVLGMLKKGALSAYDIQKLREYCERGKDAGESALFFNERRGEGVRGSYV